MYISVQGIKLNNDDFTAGGEAIPIFMDRKGKLETKEKTTYKSVYKDDETYHYPKIADNKSRIEGHLSFKNHELTG